MQHLLFYYLIIFILLYYNNLNYKLDYLLIYLNNLLYYFYLFENLIFLVVILFECQYLKNRYFIEILLINFMNQEYLE